jgi:hypothetical protein
LGTASVAQREGRGIASPLNAPRPTPKQTKKTGRARAQRRPRALTGGGARRGVPRAIVVIITRRQ